MSDIISCYIVVLKRQWLVGCLLRIGAAYDLLWEINTQSKNI